MAIFYYVAFAAQLLVGMIPRGSDDPGKYYRENSSFFWTYISILFLVFFIRQYGASISIGNGCDAILMSLLKKYSRLARRPSLPRRS